MRLFGDGQHGQAERIQTFRGPACRSTCSARRHTPLYRLKTPSQQIAVVLSALAEGLDASAAERVFGSQQATITTWLSRAARARSDVARAHFPQPLAPASAVG
jgi:transposase-like protein